MTARVWRARAAPTSSLRAQRSNPESFRGGTLDCFAALAMTVWQQSAYRQDNPASIVVQKPQCSGASCGAPAWAANRWASNRKTATVKTIRAEENRTKRLRIEDAFNRH